MMTTEEIREFIRMVEYLMDRYSFIVDSGAHDDKMARKAFILDLLALFDIQRNKQRKIK